MYGIFTYIYHKFTPNVGKYSIHGAYGIHIPAIIPKSSTGPPPARWAPTSYKWSYGAPINAENKWVTWVLTLLITGFGGQLVLALAVCEPQVLAPTAPRDVFLLLRWRWVWPIRLVSSGRPRERCWCLLVVVVCVLNGVTVFF